MKSLHILMEIVTHDGSLLQPNKNHVAAQSEESEAGCEEESPGASAADSCSDGSGQREEVMKMFEQINTRVERLEKENVRLREIGDRIRPLGRGRGGVVTTDLSRTWPNLDQPYRANVPMARPRRCSPMTFLTAPQPCPTRIKYRHPTPQGLTAISIPPQRDLLSPTNPRLNSDRCIQVNYSHFTPVVS